MNDIDLDALYAELADFAPPEKKDEALPRKERILTGFEEIQRFVAKQGHVPRHGEDYDIFERLYAVRLDRLRAVEECRSLLMPFDHQGLLSETPTAIGEDELLAETLEIAQEIAQETAGSSEITRLCHVRASAERRAAEEIANRKKCPDFERFKPLFQRVQRELKSGIRTTRQFVKDAGFLKADIKVGEFFILGGQTAYVAEVGEPIKAPNGQMDARLRVIYSNGTESDLLLRSLQRALYKDEAGRRISEPSAGPLFADKIDDDDQPSGTIYVLQSKSDHPVVAAHRSILHKIGVTSGAVERRIADARLDPTFLMAEVEIVATYDIFNIHRFRLEALIHKIFGGARLEVEVCDRFGQPVMAKEWFLAPFFVIDEAVGRIKDGTITNYVYDPKTARLALL